MANQVFQEENEIFEFGSFSGMTYSSFGMTKTPQLSVDSFNISLGVAEGWSPRYGLDPFFAQSVTINFTDSEYGFGGTLAQAALYSDIPASGMDKSPYIFAQSAFYNLSIVSVTDPDNSAAVKSINVFVLGGRNPVNISDDYPYIFSAYVGLKGPSGEFESESLSCGLVDIFDTYATMYQLPGLYRDRLQSIIYSQNLPNYLSTSQFYVNSAPVYHRSAFLFDHRSIAPTGISVITPELASLPMQGYPQDYLGFFGGFVGPLGGRLTMLNKYDIAGSLYIGGSYFENFSKYITTDASIAGNSDILIDREDGLFRLNYGKTSGGSGSFSGATQFTMDVPYGLWSSARAFVLELDHTISANYTAIFTAGIRPYAFIINRNVPSCQYTYAYSNVYERSATPSFDYPYTYGSRISPIDIYNPLNFNPAKPTKIGNVNPVSSSLYYEQFSTSTGGGQPIKQTCWDYWPAYTGAALSYPSPSSPIQFNVFVQDVGVFQPGFIYEIAYSVFDKELGLETNVGVGAVVKFPTGGASDTFCITVGSKVSAGTPFSVAYGSSGVSGTTYVNLAPPIVQNIQLIGPDIFPDNPELSQKLNVQSYRFYTRPLNSNGTFGGTWFCIGEIDRAHYHFDVHEAFFVVGKKILPNLGPREFGSLDSSPLPRDNWIQTFNWHGCNVYLSPTKACVSGYNNPLVYPKIHYLNCPKGFFIGGIAHVFPGQSFQSSRMVLFSSEMVFIVTTRGIAQFYENIWASPNGIVQNSENQYYLDTTEFGSDTCYSSRSMIVADSFLFWWGPNGVFRDVGDALPVNISRDFDLDLYLGTVLDKSKVSDILSVYNGLTKEILWFFVGKDGVQRMLVYNIKYPAFTYFKFKDDVIVYSAQNVKANYYVEGKNFGERILVTFRRKVDAVDDTPEKNPHFEAFLDTLSLGSDNYSFRPLASNNNVPNFGNVVVLTDVGTSWRFYLSSPVWEPSNLPAIGSKVVVPDNDLTINGTPIFENAAGVYVVTATGVDTVIHHSYVEVAKIPGKNFVTFTEPTGPYSFPVYFDSMGIEYKAVTRFWNPKGVRSFWDFQINYNVFRVNILDRDSSLSDPSITLKYYSMLRGSLRDGSPNIVNFAKVSENSEGYFQVVNELTYQAQRAQGQAIALEYAGVKYGDFNWTLQYADVEALRAPKGEYRQFEIEEV